MLLSANEVRHLRSTFGGVVEVQVKCLAVHFRYLAQVMDAYGKRYLKTDPFVRLETADCQL